MFFRKETDDYKKGKIKDFFLKIAQSLKKN